MSDVSWGKLLLNTHFDRRVVLHTASREWQASPSPAVWRKRLELSGPEEAGRVTSIVRYDPDSTFATHAHPDGEEILVLEGVFSDEHGDYPAGSFLLNPEGFSHAPRSIPGCRLFVKLRQYPGTGRTQVLLTQADLVWLPSGESGVSQAVLYAEALHPELIRLLRFDAGTTMALSHEGGLELFVVEGDLEDGTHRLVEGSWGRYPPGTSLNLSTDQGARCYVKSGHLERL